MRKAATALPIPATAAKIVAHSRYLAIFAVVCAATASIAILGCLKPRVIATLMMRSTSSPLVDRASRISFSASSSSMRSPKGGPSSRSFLGSTSSTSHVGIVRGIVFRHDAWRERRLLPHTTQCRARLPMNSLSRLVPNGKDRRPNLLACTWLDSRQCVIPNVDLSSSWRLGREKHLPAATRTRSTSVPERAVNCGHQRSSTGIANGLRPEDTQVDPLPETTF